MPKTLRKTPTADEIAERASRGEDVSAYFTNQFTVVRPVRRVKTLLGKALDEETGSRAGSKKKAS